MASYSDFVAIVDRLARGLPDWVELQPIFHRAFELGSRAASGHDDEVDVVRGLNGLRAVARYGCGIVVSHGEGFLLNEQIAAMVNETVGLPDDPDARVYQHPNDDVEGGLEGFDRWLHDHYISRLNRDREQDRRDGRTPRLGTGREMRLVGIDTGADWWMSVAHPASMTGDLMAAFATVGIATHRHAEVSSPVPRLVDAGSPAEYVTASLIRNHGFDSYWVRDTPTRWVDDQHALVVRPGGSGDLAEPVTVYAELIRRDICDLRRTLKGDIISGQYQGVISPLPAAPFVDRPPQPTSNSQDDIEQYLNRWVPQLLDIANSDFIESWLAEFGDIAANDLCALNRALAGATTNDDDQLLTKLYPTYPAWLEANPNGTRSRVASP